MKWTKRVGGAGRCLLAGSALLCVAVAAFGQVSPAAILNPQLKAEESKYLSQLLSLQQAIAATKFPFPFHLARYLKAHSGHAARDRDGIEFVYFQDRLLLKVSGIYGAALNAQQMTENQRASRVLQDVIVPVLRLVTQTIPPNVDCDGIGFEIMYDARDVSKTYDYEGREALVVVFSRDDAFAYARATGDAARQEILNRSDIYVDGKEFGLALGQRNPLNVESLERSVPRQARRAASSGTGNSVSTSAAASSVTSVAAAQSAPLPSPTSADVARLQAKWQPQINAMMQNDGAKFHLADTPPPIFAIENGQIALHLTMRDTLVSPGSASSIYKRAAQSFDLFLAPELKALLKDIPEDAGYGTIDFSVSYRLGAGSLPTATSHSDETIDYICPQSALRAFVENKITSQDVINQSVVLVNGARIALNLQMVE